MSEIQEHPSVAKLPKSCRDCFTELYDGRPAARFSSAADARVLAIAIEDQKKPFRLFIRNANRRRNRGPVYMVVLL
jgi:hypothetical protein